MTEQQFEAAMRTFQPEIKDGDLTEKQFEAAMRSFRLERQYRDYIMEKLGLENGDGIFRLMNSGDFYQGFKEKMTGNQNEQR
jgi:PleD family two-component response regulator